MRNYRLGLGVIFYAPDGAAAGAATAEPPAANAGGNGSSASGAGAGASGAATPPPAATTPPAGQSAAEWIAGIKDEALRGYIQQKGFQDVETLAKSYNGLEKLMGVPKDQLLKLPTDLNTPEGEQVFKRLGKPDTADGYGLDAPKDAKAEDKAFTDWAKANFHKANLTTAQAKALVQEFTNFQTAQAQAQAQAAEVESKNQFEKLKTEWGNAYDQKIAVSAAAAKQFGLTPEQIDGIQKVVGYENTMKLFNNIGSKLGEAPFVAGADRSGNGPTDTLTAKAAIAARKADQEFMARYANGDAVAKAEMSRLFKDAFPGEITIG